MYRETAMTRSINHSLLASLLALPLLASAQTTWTGAQLSISGNRANGCDLRVVSVTHMGSTLSSLRFTVANRATSAVRAYMDVTLSGNNQRKSGPVSGLIGGGQQATLQGFHPFGGTLSGSTLALRFTGCTPG